MNNLKKNFWFWGFLLLLILNITAVVSMVMHRHYVERECGYKNGCPKSNEMPKPIRECINFDDAQWAKMKEIRQTHLEEMEVLRSDLKKNHLALFDVVSSGNENQKMIDSLKQEICFIHNRISDEAIIFYKNSRAVCKPEQVKELDNHFRTMFLRPEKPNHHSGRR